MRRWSLGGSETRPDLLCPILHVLVMIPPLALFEVGILLVQIYLPTPKSPALTNSQRSDSFQ